MLTHGSEFAIILKHDCLHRTSGDMLLLFTLFKDTLAGSTVLDESSDIDAVVVT